MKKQQGKIVHLLCVLMLIVGISIPNFASRALAEQTEWQAITTNKTDDFLTATLWQNKILAVTKAGELLQLPEAIVNNIGFPVEQMVTYNSEIYGVTTDRKLVHSVDGQQFIETQQPDGEIVKRLLATDHHLVLLSTTGKVFMKEATGWLNITPADEEIQEGIIVGEELFLLTKSEKMLSAQIAQWNWTVANNKVSFQRLWTANGVLVNDKQEVSKDKGLTWIKLQGANGQINSIAYFNSLYYLFTDSGTYQSEDGITYRLMSEAVKAIHSVVHADQTLIAVGQTGQAWQLVAKKQEKARLTNLRVKDFTFTTPFSPDTFKYDVVVPKNMANIVIEAQFEQGTIAKLNEVEVQSGKEQIVALKAEDTTVTLVVNRADHESSSYEVTIKRTAPLVPYLSSLQLKEVPLLTKFSPTVFQYRAEVPVQQQFVEVEAEAEQGLQFTVEGLNSDNKVPLAIGDNSFTIVVENKEEKTKQVYTIVVKRHPLYVKRIAVVDSVFTQSVEPRTTEYEGSVLYEQKQVTFNVELFDKTSLKVNGAPAKVDEAIIIPLNIGKNDIVLTVEDEEKHMTNYRFSVVRKGLALKQLSLSEAKWNEAFSQSVFAYSTKVEADVEKVTLDWDSIVNTTVSMKGISYEKQAVLPLVEGMNTFELVVKNGEDVVTYTLSIYRNHKPTTALAKLLIKDGKVNEEVSSERDRYTATVAKVENELVIEALEEKATIFVNGEKWTKSTVWKFIEPNTTVTIKVVASDQTEKTYTLVVQRELAKEAELTSLSLKDIPFTEAFNAGKLTYEAKVNSDVKSVRVESQIKDYSFARVTVNGELWTMKEAKEIVLLPQGPTVVTIVVTAEDGKLQKTYTITIKKTDVTNAKLSNLLIMDGPGLADFSPDKTGYETSVNAQTATMRFKLVTEESGVTIQLNGKAIKAGEEFNVPLLFGANELSFIVTAIDGKTQKVYKLIVTRLKSNNANLSGILLSAGATLTPRFNPNVTNYQVELSQMLTTVTITPYLADGTAQLYYNGQQVTNGMPNVVTALAGKTEVALQVVAQDGTTRKQYNVTINKASTGNAFLSQLQVESVNLLPNFSSLVTSYSGAVAKTVSAVGITVDTIDPEATVKINGNKVAKKTKIVVDVKPGINQISISVTATNGVIRNYVVRLTRAETDNPNARLTKVDVGGGDERNLEIVSSQSGNEIVDTLIIPQEATSNLKVREYKISILAGGVLGVANRYVVRFEREAVVQLADQKATVQLTTPFGSVTMSNELLVKLKSTGAQLFFTAGKVDSQLLEKQAPNAEIIGQSVNISFATPGVTSVTVPLNFVESNQLERLAMFIQHSDGTIELAKGDVVTNSSGQAVALTVKVTKFSTFTPILQQAKTSPTKPTPLTVTVFGEAKVGATLQASVTGGDSKKIISYQWYRQSKTGQVQTIQGATTSLYKVSQQDYDYTVYVVAKNDSEMTVSNKLTIAPTKVSCEKNCLQIVKQTPIYQWKSGELVKSKSLAKVKTTYEWTKLVPKAYSIVQQRNRFIEQSSKVKFIAVPTKVLAELKKKKQVTWNKQVIVRGQIGIIQVIKSDMMVKYVSDIKVSAGVVKAKSVHRAYVVRPAVYKIGVNQYVLATDVKVK